MQCDSRMALACNCCEHQGAGAGRILVHGLAGRSVTLTNYGMIVNAALSLRTRGRGHCELNSIARIVTRKKISRCARNDTTAMSRHHSDGRVLTHRLSVISSAARNLVTCRPRTANRVRMAFDPLRQVFSQTLPSAEGCTCVRGILRQRSVKTLLGEL